MLQSGDTNNATQELWKNYKYSSKYDDEGNSSFRALCVLQRQSGAGYAGDSKRIGCGWNLGKFGCSWADHNRRNAIGARVQWGTICLNHK